MFLVALAATLPAIVFGAVMQSSTYRIQSDSLNVGGVNSVSSSYNMQDTVGEVATGLSTSTNYNMNAGYQQMQQSYISITSAGNTTLPIINTLFGGVSTSSLSWTVTTDDPAGYSLAVAAATSPALKSPLASFADYVPAGAPDYSFSVGANASSFGFSPEGNDIVARFKDNGSACNTGSSDTADHCWDGFSTSGQTVAQSTAANHPSGTATSLKFRAEVGSSYIQVSGTYSAAITLTAVAL